jgi:hypothetical protein
MLAAMGRPNCREQAQVKVGYSRVSTKEQTLDLQVDALKKAGCTRIYTETVGGAKAERPELTKVMDSVRAGDVLVIWKLDRLGRSLRNLIDIVNDLLHRKVGLKRALSRFTVPLLPKPRNARYSAWVMVSDDTNIYLARVLSTHAGPLYLHPSEITRSPLPGSNAHTIRR